ncbi:MAG: hypothetical protein QF704_17890, partial [Anaerolineales bacterium]|nr:hypothetical protein [Anaerolineales bacterium]
ANMFYAWVAATSDDTLFIVKNSKFINNKSTDTGGGNIRPLFFNSGHGKESYFENNLFVGNGSANGFRNDWDTKLTIKNCTFVFEENSDYYFSGINIDVSQSNFDHSDFEKIAKSSSTNKITLKNNYWNTADTTVLHSKTYDYQDDFQLKRVNFAPVLSTPNNSAPSRDTTPPTGSVNDGTGEDISTISVVNSLSANWSISDSQSGI